MYEVIEAIEVREYRHSCHTVHVYVLMSTSMESTHTVTGVKCTSTLHSTGIIVNYLPYCKLSYVL